MGAEMKRKFMQLAFALCAAAVLAAVVLPTEPAYATETDNPVIRVGLEWSGTALAAASLENSEGSGYRFGYFDSDRRFVSLASTDEAQITVLKTQNMYLTNGTYASSPPSGAYVTIGCYHIELPGTYPDFSSAQQAAAQMEGAFPAYISGTFTVRVGAYGTKGEAEAAQSALGISNTVIKGTSTNGVSVVKTGTADIILQFDGGTSCSLGVMPGLDDSLKPITLHNECRYYGGFQFQRLNGNITVVNFVELEDYLKGVLPYEMSESWPLEALKAQAVCARNYAVLNMGKHESYGFDLCSNIDCQTYYGLNRTGENSIRAVEETRGMYLYYNGKLAETFYFSSDGGATEDVYNVWGSNYPYLKGVEDPYEALVADSIPSYHWSTTFTAEELTQVLNSKGYDCKTVVSFEVTTRSEMGNVTAITFTDVEGNRVYLTRERVRTVLNLRSQRYEVTVGGQSSGENDGGNYAAAGGGTISAANGLYTISGTGSVNAVSGDTLYVATGSGTQTLTGTGGGSGGGDGGSGTTFTITGTGYGHHIGMSQWGAYSMAKEGYTYEDILTFYFTGTTVA